MESDCFLAEQKESVSQSVSVMALTNVFRVEGQPEAEPGGRERGDQSRERHRM